MICTTLPLAPAAQAVELLDLGVNLGEGAEAVMQVNLQQDTVHTQAVQLIRKWREDAYNDSRIKFTDDNDEYRTVPELLQESGMTKEQYLAPAWDNALERIAIQRALESQFTMNHERTCNNGEEIWSATYQDTGSYGEVLAWTWGDFSSAFNLWMSEKDAYIDYVKKNGNSDAVVGHYTSIVSPYSKNMGFGWINGTGAGEISGGNGDTQPTNYRGTYVLEMAVQDSIAKKAVAENLRTWMAAGTTVTARMRIPDGVWPGGDVTGNDGPFFYGNWSSSNNNVVKGDVTQLIAVAAGTANVTFTTPSGYYWTTKMEVRRFNDVDSKTPHVEDINWLSDSGITTGYANKDGSKRYEGMTSVYRQDMAAFLRRESVKRNIGDAATWKPSASDWQAFRDVDARTPHAEDILWLAHAGISTGWAVRGGKEFRGMDTVKRQDMAAFLRRLAAKAGKDSGIAPKTDFVDVHASTPHVAEVQWLGGSGISEGWKTSHGTEFRGMNSVVRQDMAAFLHRLDSLLAK